MPFPRISAARDATTVEAITLSSVWALTPRGFVVTRGSVTTWRTTTDADEL